MKRVSQTLRSFGIVVMFTNSAKISTPIGIMKSMEHPLREQVFRDRLLEIVGRLGVPVAA